MAKKTNKTDHVLNLLSSGKKSGREENDAPPVDLRRKAPESLEEELAEETFQELPEPRMTQREEEPLPEPRMSDMPGGEPLPEPKISVGSEEKPISVVGVAAVAPSVSVVHASDGEDTIAEAVKESLEAEFDDFLKERKESTGINVFELLGADAEEEYEPIEGPEPLAEEDVEEPDGQDAEPVEETIEEHVTENTAEPDIPAEEAADAGSEEPAEEADPIEPKSPVEEVTGMEPENLSEEGADAEFERPVEETTAAEQEEAQLQVGTEGTKTQEDSEAPSQKEAVQQKEEHMQQPNEEEKNYIMVNVMEYLVRDQVPKYVRQFGHCDCDRCIEDTVALTLTHLPSKYVVVNKNAVSPLLNFYEKKYAGQLIVEITKATMIVNESPHH